MCATDVAAYPLTATSSSMAMRMRRRWDACTSSRVRWWRPRGSGLFQERSMGTSEPEPLRPRVARGRSPEDPGLRSGPRGALEQAELIGLDPPQLVVVHLDPPDRPGLGQDPRLRLDLLSHEHAPHGPQPGIPL